MTVSTAHVSDSLQLLIDSRLDTIDRMLLGRVPRQDRLAIVREVESQIYELLHERGVDDLNREDVLAVLARLDPPEAYLPDEFERDPERPHRPVRELPSHRTLMRDSKVGRASGILGLAALASTFLLPVTYFVAEAARSEVMFLILTGGALMLSFSTSVLGVTLGTLTRKTGVWPVVGIVTSLLAMFLNFASIGAFVLLG